MVTLFDVLSLSSCGFSSVRRFMDAEVKKALETLTGRPIVLANNGNIGIAIDELIQRKNKKKQSKELFLKAQANWLASVQLLVMIQHLYSILIHLYSIFIPSYLHKQSQDDRGPDDPGGDPGGDHGGEHHGDLPEDEEAHLLGVQEPTPGNLGVDKLN